MEKKELGRGGRNRLWSSIYRGNKTKWKEQRICIHIADSLFCTAESSNIVKQLYSNNKIKKKKNMEKIFFPGQLQRSPKAWIRVGRGQKSGDQNTVSRTAIPAAHPPLPTTTSTCAKWLVAAIFCCRLKSKKYSLNKLHNMPGKGRVPSVDEIPQNEVLLI